MSCTLPTLPSVVTKDGTIAVTDKIRILADEALSTNSVYMRAKDTFKELFDGKNITNDEYAQLAGQFVSQLAVATTQSILQGAIEWAKAEKELVYSLAKAEAEVELVMAEREKAAYEICKLQKDIELQGANITATLATSIRKNGRVAASDVNNPYIPLALQDEGSEFIQMQAIEAQKYSTLADAYRKSGVVNIATTADGETKGVAGDNMGYTDAQEEFARRQVKSFEDSKRNHAANAMSQMIGQMLSAEVAPEAADITRWRNAIDYLNTNTP